MFSFSHIHLRGIVWHDIIPQLHSMFSSYCRRVADWHVWCLRKAVPMVVYGAVSQIYANQHDQWKRVKRRTLVEVNVTFNYWYLSSKI